MEVNDEDMVVLNVDESVDETEVSIVVETVLDKLDD